MERRDAYRYIVSLRAVVCPQSGSGIPQIGLTSSVSNRGVYLLLGDAVSVNNSLDVTLFLLKDADADSLVRIRAKVVRIEFASTEVGIAASIESYKMVRLHIQPSS
jgi:hypothetical protein